MSDTANNDNPVTEFSRYRAVVAEGARIALMSCLTCGATVMVDPADDFDAVTLHDEWHEAQHDDNPSTATPPETGDPT